MRRPSYTLSPEDRRGGLPRPQAVHWVQRDAHRDAHRARLWVLILATLYNAAMVCSYVGYVIPQWGYFGIFNRPLDNWAMLSTVLVCGVPAIWMPIKIRRPTMFLYWALYLMTYVPMIIGVNLD